jgi:hypothetical protein
VRALVDRHQADLFYSLQLLFEDRLGIEVYTPIGREWWDEGYWNFGRGTYPDDRLAAQYLHNATHRMYDGHHPERLIRGVTLAEFRDMPFGYVVATLQDNQEGFARLAREKGAKYVLQVGNTGQQVDWTLDPLALVSSEVPIRGKAVLYHQEFDSERTFGFRELPSDRGVVRSFVNCMPDTYCWPLTQSIKAELGYPFTVHGINGPDGIIEPVTAIADLMASAGWAYHDKPHGDGFGHVIHNWAAIGRPLIGHAGHYRGMLAEPFWEDGVTCVDLDRHGATEAANLIREITADRDRHAAMGKAIRQRFDELVDWDTEAQAIAEFLA